MQQIKEERPPKPVPEQSRQPEECSGRQIWARGYFVMTLSVEADQAIIECVSPQKIAAVDEASRFNE